MNVERVILSALNNIKPRLLTVGTLWSEVRLDCDDLTYSGFKESLTNLETKEQIVVITGEDRNKAKITQAGEARLAE